MRQGIGISIHAPREGSDFDATKENTNDKDISIHAPREGSDVGQLRLLRKSYPISIHAPREGSDGGLISKPQVTLIISIHAPREGSDGLMILFMAAVGQFQSTLPVRGATFRCPAQRWTPIYFNPRSP